MFTLAREPKDSIEFEGVEYQVDMAFDNILRVQELMNDDSLTGADQIEIALKMFFDEIPDLSGEKLVELFYYTYTELLGEQKEDSVTYDIKGNPMPKNRKIDEDGEPIDDSAPFDLEQDAQVIYSSFMQCYGMDLYEQQGKLHWYKFMALLSGLSDDTRFKQIVKIRMDPLPTGKGVAKEREHMKKLKKEYALKPKRGEVNG